MLRFIKKTWVHLLVALNILLFITFPFSQQVFGTHCEILPAVDLAVIFYFSTYRRIKYWHIFIFGIVIDQLYTLPFGITSALLLPAEFCLRIIPKWVALRDYFTNLLIFVCYCMVVILGKYMLVTILSHNHLDYISTVFYFLTTILVYPIMHLIMDTFFKHLGKNAG